MTPEYERQMEWLERQGIFDLTVKSTDGFGTIVTGRVVYRFKSGLVEHVQARRLTKNYSGWVTATIEVIQEIRARIEELDIKHVGGLVSVTRQGAGASP